MMGGSAGVTSGQPGTGQVFLPPNQDIAAQQWQEMIKPLLSIGANGGAGTPAAANYPSGQNFVDRFLTGRGAGADTFNDLASRAFNPAYGAADYASSSLVPRGIAQGDTLHNLGYGGIPYAQQALTQGFDPNYGLDTQDFGLALGGARQGATLGGAGANQIFNQAGQIAGAIDPLMQSGFDPRSALFNRSRQQLMDQTNATNAMSGLAGTPYGASVAANALGNFDINWQNQQLARQAQAAEAARGAAGTSSALYSAAPGVATSAAAAPNATILQQLAQRNAGAASGLGNYATSTQNIGNLFQGAQNAGTQAAQTGMQFGAAPYNLGQQMTSNALAGATGATNLGNQQYQLPMELMEKINQYMGMGRDASKIGGALQGQEFNQQSQGIGGLLSGLTGVSNLLFGSPAGGLASSSDRRLKTNIKRVGTLDNGLPVYLFRYKDTPNVVHMGLMADEVEKVHPEAVIDRDGFKAVYYDQAVL